MLNHKKYTIPKDRKKSRTYLVVKCAAILNFIWKFFKYQGLLKRRLRECNWRKDKIEDEKKWNKPSCQKWLTSSVYPFHFHAGSIKRNHQNSSIKILHKMLIKEYLISFTTFLTWKVRNGQRGIVPLSAFNKLR